MNWNLFKGYFMVLVSGVVIIAAALMLIVQGSTTCDVSIYFDRQITSRVNLLMLLSAVGGIVLMFFLRVMMAGFSALKKGRLERLGNRKLSELVPPPDQQTPTM